MDDFASVHSGSRSGSGTETKVSIIVPCYKVESYLPRCLDSLICQTFSDYEVICVNDGSPDRCSEILQRYQSDNPNVIKVIEKQNEGTWKARLDGISIARGSYIGFVDGDDYVVPDFIESLYQVAVEEGADIAVAGFCRVDENTGRVLSVEMTKKLPSFDASASPENLIALNGAPWNKLFASSLLKRLVDLRHTPRIYEDIIMHLLIYPTCGRVAYVGKNLVKYTVRRGSTMSSVDEGKIESVYLSMRDVRDVYGECGYLQDWAAFLDAEAFLHLGVSLMFSVSYDKGANLRSILKRNKEYLDTYFPSWRSSKIISSSNAKRFGGAMKRLYLARAVYRMGLMSPALACYRMMISLFHADLKW